MENEKFTLNTIHTNHGEQPAPLNFAEHFYIATSRRWHGTKINDFDVTAMLAESQRLPFVIELLPTNIVEIPGLPKLYLEQTNLPLAVLWVGGPKGGPKDQHYITIEPTDGNPFDFFSTHKRVCYILLT